MEQLSKPFDTGRRITHQCSMAAKCVICIYGVGNERERHLTENNRGGRSATFFASLVFNMNTVTHAPILHPPTPYNEFRIVSNLPEEPATDVTVLSKTGAGARVDGQMLGFSVVFNTTLTQ